MAAFVLVEGVGGRVSLGSGIRGRCLGAVNTRAFQRQRHAPFSSKFTVIPNGTVTERHPSVVLPQVPDLVFRSVEVSLPGEPKSQIRRATTPIGFRELENFPSRIGPTAKIHQTVVLHHVFFQSGLGPEKPLLPELNLLSV